MPDTHFYRPTHFYHYDDYDRTLVAERVEQFRDQVRRRIAGELTEEQFKPLRLTNGLYLQLHAYMLRIAIPYGTLSSRQLRKLADISRKYDRGYGHFTTRQNLQLNWIKLEDAPDALAALAEVDMHAIQTSGNCIRNVTADHYAGAAIDEIEDPRIWCEIVRQWSTLHPEFSFLPRKFKIAITGSPNDRAAVRVHDIGLRIWANEAGEVGFEVIVGGGLGRTPMIGKTLREFLPRDELLAYLEATLRVYNRYGRRDNLYKARIKILVHEIGAEKMREAECSILGGHSVADEEIKFGYAVTGVIHPARVKPNAGARPGDALIFTKRIGTGVIGTALKRGIASDEHVEGAIRSMLTLNRRACEEMLRFEVHGVTDVSGFGLIGHAREMALGSNVTLEIQVASIRFLPGALEYSRQGALSGGLRNNREFAECVVSRETEISPEAENLLYDPQTSGGLLISLAEADAAAFERAYPDAYRIGCVLPRAAKPIRLI